MVDEAIVLAGGLGTRLRGVIGDRPKPMAEINGRPFLDYLLEYWARQGIKTVVLAVGYRHEVIRDHFGDTFHGLRLRYAVEESPYGTGGAILNALPHTSGPTVLALNGDTLFRLELRSLLRAHQESGGKLTLALKRMPDCSRYGVVRIDEAGEVVGFEEKRPRSDGLINGGVYLFEPSWLVGLGLPEVFSFEKELLERYYQRHPMLGIPCDGYFIDIGVPEDFERAKRDLTE